MLRDQALTMHIKITALISLKETAQPFLFEITILLIKTTATQNEVAHSYHRVRGLYFLAVVFAAILIMMAVG